MTAEPIDIVIDAAAEEDQDDVEEEAKDEGALVNSGARLSFYTASKVFAWVARARIAAWFRIAFQLPSSSEASSRATTPLNQPSPSRSLCLSPEAAARRKKSLTLEPDYESYRVSTRPQTGRFSAGQVPKMLRSASGPFNEEFTRRVHSQIIDETAKIMLNRRSSERQMTKDEQE